MNPVPSPERSVPTRALAAVSGLLRNAAPGFALSFATLVLIAGLAEVYLRLTAPTFVTEWPIVFDSATVDRLRPGAEVATTNHLDYWNRQRANSLGFLDREPVAPDDRPGSCHVVFIGDSFVEAHQVDIPIKMHVVLEEMAAEELPQLKLTTAAFGMSGTGQLNQLPYYDNFARRQSPKIVVLVFVKNDFSDNSALLYSVDHGLDPDHQPKLFARRNTGGEFELQPIDPAWRQYVLTPPYQKPAGRLRDGLQEVSLAYRWIEEHAWRGRLFIERWLYGTSAVAYGSERLVYNAGLLARRPEWAPLLSTWDVAKAPAIDEVYFDRDIAPIFQEALAFTGFALDQFQERARRDGFHIVILATQTMKREDGSGAAFDRLTELAAKRNIPVIDMHNHVVSQGGQISETRLRYDGHWTRQGHRWAAEAMLNYLARHPELCK